MISNGKPILDACCGSRMFWFDKDNPFVEFMDIRDEECTLSDEDFRKMAKWSIRKMAKWSIRKMFENYPDETISLKELKTQLEFAWDELVEDEEIEAPGEGFINE